MSSSQLLPPGLDEATRQRALTYAKLASKSYDLDDWLLVRISMNLFSGIDDILNVDFDTPEYRKAASGGNAIDWWGGKDQGLDYTVFEHKTNKNLVIAFRGTEPLSFEDWLQDASQILGRSETYVKAVQLARETAAKVEAQNKKNGTAVQLSFCGHSLGGGLATAAALATGLEAFAFDAAGISDLSVKSKDLGLDVAKNASKVTNFNVQGCFVSDWNEKMDATTLGTAGSLYTSKQCGRIFWLQGIEERAAFLPARLMPFVGGTLEARAETFLAHAWHVFTYQIQHKNFVVSSGNDATGSANHNRGRSLETQDEEASGPATKKARVSSSAK